MPAVNVRMPALKRPADDKTEAKKAKTGEDRSRMNAETAELLKKFSKIDTNDKLYDLEDKIAVEMGHDAIYEQFIEQSSIIKQAVMDYMDGKKIETSMTAQMAKVRRLGRLCHYATNQLRKDVSSKLDIVDAKVLQLQNTMSEVQHIRKEIDRCLDFSGGDEEIDLIPIEQFYEKAPESVSQPEKTKDNEHLQKLARLNFEVEQRRQMNSTLSELEGRRNVLVSDITGKEQRLQKLTPTLEALKKASEPIQELLSVKYKDVEMEANQRQLALSLPTSLIILHTHAIAYKEIMGDKHVDVTIVRLDENQTRLVEKDGASGKTKRNEKEETVQDKIEEARSAIFDAHPLHVEVEVDCPQNDVKVKLFFYYLSELKVGAMKWTVNEIPKSKSSAVLNEEVLLADLFEEDSGNKCPDVIGELKMQHLKLTFDSVAKTTGKPYKFVQVLCGASEEFEGTQLTDYFRKVINAVRRRVEERFQLDTIVRSLESRKLDNIEQADGNSVKITLFRHCEEEKFASSIPTSLAKLIAESTVSELFSYKADFEDEQKNRLTAFISIPCDYPSSCALFGLTTTTEGCEERILQIETAINTMSTSLEKQVSALIGKFDFVFSKC